MWINTKGQYVYQRKPRICKHCGSRAIATYYFGYPSEETFILAEQYKLIKLGGGAELKWENTLESGVAMIATSIFIK